MLRNKAKRVIAIIIPIIIIGTSNGVTTYSAVGDSTVATASTSTASTSTASTASTVSTATITDTSIPVLKKSPITQPKKELVKTESIYFYTDANGLNYIIDDVSKTAKVSDCGPGEAAGAISIPEKVDYNGEEYRITRIDSFAFKGDTDLTSITIPDSIISIGDNVFEQCTNLTSVKMPNSITSIGDTVFFECSSLTSVTIPSSVTSIGLFAFEECGNLQSITIPGGVTSIGDFAFSECGNLKSIIIPNSVTSIGNTVAERCNYLNKSITGNGGYQSEDGVLFYKGGTTSNNSQTVNSGDRSALPLVALFILGILGMLAFKTEPINKKRTK